MIQSSKTLGVAGIGLLLLASPGAAGGGGGSSVYMDDSCNGVTGVTNTGKPCGRATPPADSEYTRGFEEGYARGRQDGLAACPSSPGDRGAAPSGSGPAGQTNGPAAPPRAGGTPTGGSGGKPTGPSRFDCLRSFYDASYHGWLALENVCSEPIYVAYRCWKGFPSGATTLAPGKRDSTGSSKREIDAAGGISFAVCGDGFLPYGTNGRVWNEAGAEYTCRKR